MTVQIDITYRARPGHGLSHKEAAIVGPVLQGLVETSGRLDPQLVVRTARPKGSPLHRHFEWDDRKAGERFRLWQARQLVRSVEIVIEESSEPIPAFYSVAMTDDEQDREYMPLRDVLTDETLLTKTKARFRRDIARLQQEYDLFRKAASFEEFAGSVLTAVDDTLEVTA